MIVTIEKLNSVHSDLGLCGLRFNFVLEDDDCEKSQSKNIGGSDISLQSNFCNFYFPMELDIPHLDLCAFAALKIISPYIGTSFSIGTGVSYSMAKSIREEYPNIQKIKTNASLSPISDKSRNNVAISFSGGVDSIAASVMMGDDVTLVMAARTFHPEIGEFEQWNNPRAQVKTLRYMPCNYKKVLVYTDFPFLSVKNDYCTYPDSYSFTIPAVLLSERLGFAHIITGDIHAAFTDSETIHTNDCEASDKKFFSGIGINLDYPCNGLSELITTSIAKANGLLEISSACEYGDFMKPCMGCIKCFRKSIYRWALFNEPLSNEDIIKLNNSPAIKSYAENNEKGGFNFMPSLKYCFSVINKEFDGSIEIIRQRAMSYHAPYGWVMKRDASAYVGRAPLILSAIDRSREYFSDMQEWDETAYSMLNWEMNKSR
ncbi:hypothetical protein OSG00_000660 [Shigella sonnei]|nr:hypothetical protein [Shigella sonnei]